MYLYFISCLRYTILAGTLDILPVHCFEVAVPVDWVYSKLEESLSFLERPWRNCSAIKHKNKGSVPEAMFSDVMLRVVNFSSRMFRNCLKGEVGSEKTNERKKKGEKEQRKKRGT